MFATDDAQLLGYFALTIKPITVSGESFNNTVRKKLSRVSTLNEQEHTYSLAAYLIAQLGKNYADGARERIIGAESLGLALNQIELLQYQAAEWLSSLKQTMRINSSHFMEITGFSPLTGERSRGRTRSRMN